MEDTLNPKSNPERLELRRLQMSDAQDIFELASQFQIADTTQGIPHPYELQDAKDWIGRNTDQIISFPRDSTTWAITLKEEKTLIGTIGITIDRDNRKGTMGYWIGVPFWNNGYCTEAALLVLDHGFKKLKLNKISASYLQRNPASGRVLEKIGMVQEGTFNRELLKWDKYETLIHCAIFNPSNET